MSRYIIVARRVTSEGFGQPMHYTPRGDKGHIFTTNGRPQTYRDKSDATYLAKALVKSQPILKEYNVRVEPYRKDNPSHAASVDEAARRFEEFTGHDATTVRRVKVKTPRVMLAVGELTAIAYKVKRGGVTDEYEHEFSKDSRPLLAASHDGKSLSIVGGRFEFTPAGIEDR